MILDTSSGCGSSTNVNVSQPNPGQPGQVPAPAPTQVTKNITEIFSPTIIVVQQQVVTNIAIVTVVNNTSDDHQIVDDDGTILSPVLRPGDRFDIHKQMPGTYHYHCGVHPNDPSERGTFTVEPPPSPVPSPTPAPETTAVPSPVPSVVPVPTPTLGPNATPSPSPVPSPANTIIITAGASTRTTDAFAPGPITVDQGAMVTVINDDTQDHTVSADDGSFDTGVIPAGQQGSFPASQAGDFPFHCRIHPKMTGVLHVVPPANPSAPSPVPPPSSVPPPTPPPSSIPSAPPLPPGT